MKVILKVDDSLCGDINLEALFATIEFGAVEQPLTMISSVKQLPPGNYLRWNKGSPPILKVFQEVKNFLPPKAYYLIKMPLKN